MLTEVNVYSKLRRIVKAKRSILKSVAKNLIEKNEEDEIDSKNLKDKDSNKDGVGSSNNSSGEDLIIDELNAPQYQNWMTAFAS